MLLYLRFPRVIHSTIVITDACIDKNLAVKYTCMHAFFLNSAVDFLWIIEDKLRKAIDFRLYTVIIIIYTTVVFSVHM